MPLKGLRAVIQKFQLRNKENKLIFELSLRGTKRRSNLGLEIAAVVSLPREDNLLNNQVNQLIMKKLTQRNNKQEAIKCLTH